MVENRPGASGADSGMGAEAEKTPAVKGRWTNLSIGPPSHGSSTSGFALRNLHKSPGGRVVTPSCPVANVWAAAASALRRLVQVSCGWPRVAAAFDLRARRGPHGSAAGKPWTKRYRFS